MFLSLSTPNALNNIKSGISRSTLGSENTIEFFLFPLRYFSEYIPIFKVLGKIAAASVVHLIRPSNE